jgi:hypothetical protein
VKGNGCEIVLGTTCVEPLAKAPRFVLACGTGTNLGTRAEPQQIVAQRLLSCLQYPVLAKSSTKDLAEPSFDLRCVV